MSGETAERPLFLTERLADAAGAFVRRLSALPHAAFHSVPDYADKARAAGTLARPVTWTNVVVSTPFLRRAHVERFEIGDQISVLHVCIFPHLSAGLPIFGFDVIAGQNRMTGAFLDLSPIDPVSLAVNSAWARAFDRRRNAFCETRTLPEWGDIFSQGVVAIRPGDAREAEAIFSLGLDSLDWLLAATVAPADPMITTAGQRRYIARQRMNEHTFRMLRGCVGDTLAREFIDRWLFPDPAET